MNAAVYWITETLAIMPRPRGNDWLEDEIISFKNQGVDVVVSLLEKEEIEELEIGQEEFYCRENEIVFLNFAIGDRQIPKSFEEAAEFIKKLSGFAAANKKIAIHCRQGIGRSSLIAASVMVLQGFSSRDAFEKIVKARGCQIPDTPEQVEWVELFAQKSQKL